ncbi:hypothetical protein [Serratia fonticola]|uniref:hypothetical protein n=1 Tax=Serratia fonticola TaxID=47917 RepID=UPI00217B70CB|nr:hypothetical protein [Serratia fonticola]CAI1933168.1 Uncharacterised protein [Serratia fonticola]
MKYEQRIVAFIDILGFKSLLNDTLDKYGNDKEDKIDAVISAYDAIRDIWNLDQAPQFLGVKTSETKKISIFSDCLVISFTIEQPSGVFATLLEIKMLIMRLISRKILCRGAVSIGKFIHTDNYLFGPALVEAYTLESKAAMYPRVILDHTVIEAGAQNRNQDHDFTEEKEYVQSLLEQDSDGMFYIDYFFKAQTELDDPEYDFPDYIENLADVIRKGLMGSSHHSKADIRVKYSWMRERFNKMVDIVTSKEALNRLNDTGEYELANFYSSLKKISPNKYNNLFNTKGAKFQ